MNKHTYLSFTSEESQNPLKPVDLRAEAKLQRRKTKCVAHPQVTQCLFIHCFMQALCDAASSHFILLLSKHCLPLDQSYWNWRGLFCNPLCNDKSLQILRLWTLNKSRPSSRLSQSGLASFYQARLNLPLQHLSAVSTYCSPRVNSYLEMVIYTLFKPMLTGRPAVCTHAILIWRSCCK